MTNEQMANLFVYVDVHQWEQVIKHLTLNAIMRSGINGAVVIKLRKLNYIKKDRQKTRNLSNITVPSVRLSARSDITPYISHSEYNNTEYIRIEFYDSGAGLTKVSNTDNVTDSNYCYYLL